jgi:hypothetical protein
MTMRVRMVRPPPIPSIDGVRLDYFVVGAEYSTGNTIGALMLAEGWAVPVPLDAPRPVEPFAEGDPFDSSTLYRSRSHPTNLIRQATVPFGERDTAAEMLRRKRHRDPRRTARQQRRASKTNRRRRHGK